MDNNSKKEYLLKMFNHLISSEDIALEEYGATQWFELRGYSTDEAKQAVLDKYRKVLLQDSPIVDTMIRFEDLYDFYTTVYDNNNDNTKNQKDSNEEKVKKYYKAYIEHLASHLCGYNFTVTDNRLTDDPDGAVTMIREIFMANEIIKNSTANTQNEFNFSALEWGAAFYYANAINAFDNKLSIAIKIRTFKDKHSINSTVKNLRNQYYTAEKRIAKVFDFPVKKLQKIIPFMKTHYKKTVNEIKDDIKIIQDQQDKSQ